MTEEEFRRTVRSIRARPREDLPGIWFNRIRFRKLDFLQGQLWTEEAPAGVYRPLAALADPREPLEIDGFWPSVSAHPLEREEESRLVSFLSDQGRNDLELIVPERNTARLMDWGRFDEAPEYPVYRSCIHPAVIEAVRKIRGHGETRPETILDVGCGCGDLLQALLDDDRKRGAGGDSSGPSDLPRSRSGSAPTVDCRGIDSNPDNVEEARRRGLPNVRVGDGEDIAALSEHGSFDILIFCGLLNRQILSREKAERILGKALSGLRKAGHVIITGYTSCHLTAEDLARAGLAVIRKSFPDRLFLDYKDYHLRQFYVARKDA